MSPHGEAIPSPYTTIPTMNNTNTNTNKNKISKPSKLSDENNLQRTISDISFELSKEILSSMDNKQLPPISEAENAKCECCGLSEEYTPEYIDQVRSKFMGKWVCGLCSEAVKEEEDKNGGNKTIEEALNSHMNACARFNMFGRAYPVLSQAQAMREILKRSTRRAKSFNHKGTQMVGGISRSSSCIAAITKDMNDITTTKMN